MCLHILLHMLYTFQRHKRAFTFFTIAPCWSQRGKRLLLMLTIKMKLRGYTENLALLLLHMPTVCICTEASKLMAFNTVQRKRPKSKIASLSSLITRVTPFTKFLFHYFSASTSQTDHLCCYYPSLYPSTPKMERDVPTIFTQIWQPQLCCFFGIQSFHSKQCNLGFFFFSFFLWHVYICIHIHHLKGESVLPD